MLARFWNLFRRRQLDLELNAELTHHLESLEAEHRARGLSKSDARMAALRDFGGLVRTKEEYRDQRGIPMIETLLKNVRFSLRSMGRTPVMTIAVVATLAIGIGANTAVFSVVNGILIKPLPYSDPERLVRVAHLAPGIQLSDSRDVGSSLFLYFVHREQSRTLEGVGVFGEGTSTVTGGREPEEVRRFFVTSDVLPLLGVQPLLGRIFSQTDDAPASPGTIVLSYEYWQRRFGGDRSVIGRSLDMADDTWTIIGVLPRGFRAFRGPVDVITPSRFDRNQVTVGGFFRGSVARLKPGVTLEQASADLARLISPAIDSFPLGPGVTREQLQRMRLAPVLKPLKQEVVGDVGNTLWVIMGTIAMVLLIACANVANLILARTEGRSHELMIRAALGAGWKRIALELFTESALFSLAGGIVGIALSYCGLRALLTIAPASLPRADEITIDPTVLLFTLGLCLVSALLFGMLPVVRYARPARDAMSSAGGRWSSGSRERLRLRGTLVVAQVAMAMVLLICAGLMIRTFQKLNDVNPGFSFVEEVQTVPVAILPASVPDPVLVVRRQHEILNRLTALPGVQSAAYTSAVPMGGGFTADIIAPEGRVSTDGSAPKARQLRFVSPGLFETLGIPLVAGRDFTWTDIYEKHPVVLITQNLARQEWGSAEEALGKRLRSGSQGRWHEIVGITGDIRDWGPSRPLTEIVYVPVLAEQIYNTPTYIGRFITYTIRSSRSGTPAFLDEIRQTVWSVDSNLPMVNLRTMGDVVADSMARTSITLLMLAIAGVMAVLLGVIGIYGVISYAVTQRTREVGIRIALGAHGGEVRGMFFRQGLVMTGVGVVIGLGGAATLTRWMSALLFEVSPLDPGTYIAVAVFLVIAAGLAIYVPARRATRVDPWESLRAE
ncbi:MAG TPA: ABC transporter permease [Terriglobia bacterium]|nr:ABC transporter permease [Terriglobia bacterium]